MNNNTNINNLASQKKQATQNIGIVCLQLGFSFHCYPVLSVTEVSIVWLAKEMFHFSSLNCEGLFYIFSDTFILLKYVEVSHISISETWVF